MLDRKFIIENVDRIKKNCADRGVKCDIDRLVELEAERRKKLQLVEEANRKANDVAKMIGKAKDAVKPLTKQLDSPDDGTRMSAALALAQLGKDAKDAVAPLQKMLNKEPNPMVRHAAGFAFGLRQKRGVP